MSVWSRNHRFLQRRFVKRRISLSSGCSVQSSMKDVGTADDGRDPVAFRFLEQIGTAVEAPVPRGVSGVDIELATGVDIAESME